MGDHYNIFMIQVLILTASNSSKNSNFSSPIKHDRKPIPVIICRLPETFNTREILIAISNLICSHTPSVHFQQKYKLYI